MFYAYILHSEKFPGTLYYGFTTNLKSRLIAHNGGGNDSTRNMRPWKLAWYGAFQTEKAARAFEDYLKTASGKAFARKRLLPS
ncbi:MAG: GIY-YIG nuclease family protein [Verrucomicrobiales bacterium]